MEKYYKLSAKSWHGDRYFKVDLTKKWCIQVVLNTGDKALSGRSNMFGIYKIALMTFVNNYTTHSYVEECSKELYESKFEECLGLLTNY